MKEVTQQGDGSEWETNDEGVQVPFSSYGQAVSKDEAQLAGAGSDVGKAGETDVGKAGETDKKSIPFLDTDSPWHKAVPVEQRKKVAREMAQNATATVTAPLQQNSDLEEKKKKIMQQREEDAVDPISTLTVAKLREILRERGLKVSGNKKELQERLRAEVQSMLHDD
jgi:hypothetical protein